MPDKGRSPHVIDIAIEPRWVPGEDRHQTLLDRLKRLEDEDDVGVHIDEESQQFVLCGRDELHLDAVIERLKGDIAINVGAAQVAYRETITRGVEKDYTHKKMHDGVGQYARIKFRIDPDTDAGCGFRSLVPSDILPAEYVAAVRRSVEIMSRAGPLIGFPVIGMRFMLLDGAHHDLDSSVAAFESAARSGFRDAIEKAHPKILEPIMRLQVVVPELYVRNVLDDLNQRRGRVVDTKTRGLTQAIEATVPLANMLGYVNSLRELGRGLATSRMDFDHYEQTPAPVDPDDRFRPAMAKRA